MDKTIEALRLADELVKPLPNAPTPSRTEIQAAAELRRLYEENQAFLAVLEFAANQSKKQPLTEERILDAFCNTKNIHQFVQAFKAGVRFAEAAHGITSGKATTKGNT